MLSFGDIIGWPRIVGWLIDNGLIVPGAEHPVVPLPGTGGAGLDGPRVVAIVAILLIWLLLMADVRGRRRRNPPRQYGASGPPA